MANFFVENARHGFDLISISYNETSFLVRAFFLENGPVDDMQEIPLENLTHNMNAYGGNSYLNYQDRNYRLQTSVTMDKKFGEIQASGTYLVYTDNNTRLYSMRLDSAKFPDLDIYDWRYFARQGMQAVLKFCLYSENQTFTDIPKVYYLNSDKKNSVIFITDDDLTNAPVSGDGQTKVLPDFTYQVTEAGITISSTYTVEGKVHIVNRKNIVIDDEYDLVNSEVVISDYSKRSTDKAASFDVLYGFSKVLTVTL